MFNIIFINIINIIIFIINKFEKKILLLLKKTIDLIWRVKLKIVVVVVVVVVILIIVIMIISVILIFNIVIIFIIIKFEKKYYYYWRKTINLI
jgi:hypothetical protein